MVLIGFARVSTEESATLPELRALKSASCADIHEEQFRWRPDAPRSDPRAGHCEYWAGIQQAASADPAILNRLHSVALTDALCTLARPATARS